MRSKYVIAGGDTFEGDGAHVYKFVKPTRFGSSP